MEPNLHTDASKYQAAMGGWSKTLAPLFIEFVGGIKEGDRVLDVGCGTRAIAKEAYIYGFPLVDNYRIQYSYFVDRNDPEYKGAWEKMHNTARVYTPDDKAIEDFSQHHSLPRFGRYIIGCCSNAEGSR